MARDVVASLNRVKNPNIALKQPQNPLYSTEELYGIIPKDARKPFDIREVIARIVDGSEFDEFKSSMAQR